MSSQNVPVGKGGRADSPGHVNGGYNIYGREVWRFNELAEVRFCKRGLAQDTLKAWHESRCVRNGAHGVLGEQSAPNKHIFAHTLCARNVACLGGNYAAVLRVIIHHDYAQGKTPAKHTRAD